MRGLQLSIWVPTLPAPLMYQGQGALVVSSNPESPRTLPPTPLPTRPSTETPPYPALCFLDLSEMPSRAMSLLKTMIPMSIFT